MADFPPIARAPIAILGIVSLIAGVLSGLARLGWEVPSLAVNAVGVHGALMISAFFGTVISLERAVAIGRCWTYQAPIAAGASGIAMLGGATSLAQYLSIYASLVMVVANIHVLRRLTAPFTIVLASGALCWLLGVIAWVSTDSPSAATPWWFSFLVLTIAGERLELSRFIPTPKIAQQAFYVIVCAVFIGATVSLFDERVGLMVFSFAQLLMAGWLLCFDIAWRNARHDGLPRFIAACLLSGYVWLGVAGALGIGGGFALGDPWRDSTLHAIGLGFVFSMVFGHAPIIFPAVARVKIPFHAMFYLPLLTLHMTLVVRVWGGLIDDFSIRRAGGMANAVALIVFFAVLLMSVLRGRRILPGKSD